MTANEPARRSQGEAAGSVTTIELFFDLVFVFTITQLTRVVADEPTLLGAARSMVIFGNLWWMYGGYVWLTNTVPPRGDRERLLLLLGMAGFLVAALAIPTGFAAGGVALGVGYLIVNVVHAWLLLGPIEGSVLRAMGWLGPANFSTAALIVAAGFTGGWVTWMLWIVAFVLHWATPYLTEPTVVTLASRHFVERHGLIVLIALGESVVAVGARVDASSVQPGHLLTAVCALGAAASLWWLYFDRDDKAIVDAFDAADGKRRSWLALHVYGYGFLPLLGGIVLFAAGLRRTLAEGGDTASTSTAALVAVGASVYLAGLVVIRARLKLGPVIARAVLGLLALPTILLGARLSPSIQLAALVCVLVGGIAAERLHIDPSGGRSRRRSGTWSR